MSAAILVLDAVSGPLELDASALQGSWTDEQYVRLTNRTNRLVELVDSRLEALPMPTDEHQGLSLWLVDALRAAVGPNGVVRTAPLRLQIRPGLFREPDLLALRDAANPCRRNDFWRGADLVIEIVSSDDPDRDYRDKRADYATANVPEYWIVDPIVRRLTVLRLGEAGYLTHAEAGPDGQVASVEVPGLVVDVAVLFAAVAAPPN